MIETAYIFIKDLKAGQMIRWSNWYMTVLGIRDHEIEEHFCYVLFLVVDVNSKSVTLRNIDFLRNQTIGLHHRDNSVYVMTLLS